MQNRLWEMKLTKRESTRIILYRWSRGPSPTSLLCSLRWCCFVLREEKTKQAGEEGGGGGSPVQLDPNKLQSSQDYTTEQNTHWHSSRKTVELASGGNASHSEITALIRDRSDGCSAIFVSFSLLHHLRPSSGNCLENPAVQMDCWSIHFKSESVPAPPILLLPSLPRLLSTLHPRLSVGHLSFHEAKFNCSKKDLFCRALLGVWIHWHRDRSLHKAHTPTVCSMRSPRSPSLLSCSWGRWEREDQTKMPTYRKTSKGEAEKTGSPPEGESLFCE